MRRIAHVEAVGATRLALAWADGGRDEVDLAGVLARFPPFAELRRPEAFRAVQVVGHGSGIEWACGLDYSADSLAHMAEAQRPMSGEEFADWQRELGLSIQQTASILGVGVTTVKAYRKLAAVPVAVRIACRALRDEPETFLALYSPTAPGRPKGSSAAA